MDYYEILKDEIERYNNEDIFITGEWGIGKSYFIKNFLSTYKPNTITNKYKMYSIINVSNFLDININKEIFYNKQDIGKHSEKNICHNAEKNNGNKIFTQFADFTKSILDSSDNTKNVSGIASGIINIASTFYIDYINNYRLDDFILVFDEIDRIPSYINKEDLISKIINLKNKYTNLKIIYISNEIPSEFEAKQEKLYSKILTIKENKKISKYKNKYTFITEETKKEIKKYKLNENNLRLFPLIDEIIKYIDLKKNNYSIQEEYLIEIKNHIYLGGHKFFSKEKYIKNLTLERIEHGLKNQDIEKKYIESRYERETKEFKEFLNFDFESINEFIKSYQKNVNIYNMRKEIKSYIRDYYILHRNNLNQKTILNLIEKYYKELKFSDIDFLHDHDEVIYYWILRYYDMYLVDDIDIKKISNILKEKFIYEINLLNSYDQKLNFKKLSNAKEILEKFKYKMQNNENAKLNFKECVGYYKKFFLILERKIKELNFFENRDKEFINYNFEINNTKFLNEVINESNDLFKDLRYINDNIDNKYRKEFINQVKIFIITNPIFCNDLNTEKILNLILIEK